MYICAHSNALVPSGVFDRDRMNRKIESTEAYCTGAVQELNCGSITGRLQIPCDVISSCLSAFFFLLLLCVFKGRASNIASKYNDFDNLGSLSSFGAYICCGRANWGACDCLQVSPTAKHSLGWRRGWRHVGELRQWWLTLQISDKLSFIWSVHIYAGPLASPLCDYACAPGGG